MWQRYNVAGRIFEKSVDNGATWTQLELNASIITHGNLSADRDWITTAYTDVRNAFTQRQELSFGVPSLVWNDTSQPANQKKFEIIQATQFLYLQAINDAENTATGSVRIDRSGNVQLSGGLTLPNSATPIGRTTTYTPTFTADGVASSLGNGTRNGKYTQIDKTIFFTINFNAGSTTNFGTGTLHFSLPKGVMAAYIGTGVEAWHGRVYNPGTGQSLSIFCTISSDIVLGMYEANTGFLLTGTSPFTMGSGVSISISGFYETI